MTPTNPDSTDSEKENSPSELHWIDKGGFISRLTKQCGSAEIKDLAKFTKIKYQTIKNYVSGERLPDAEILALIGLNTGLSLDYLLLGLGEPYRADKTRPPLSSPNAEAEDLSLWSFKTTIPPLREVKIWAESDGLHISVISDSNPTKEGIDANIRLVETTPVDVVN